MAPDNRLCFACGESVTAAASDCGHCGADLDGGDEGAVATATVDLSPPPDEGDEDASDDPGWFRRETLRDACPDRTGAVALVAGVGVAGIAAALALRLTGPVQAVLAWPAYLACLVGARVYVGRAGSPYGAARRACYALASALAVPLLVLADVGVLIFPLAAAALGYWFVGTDADG